MVDDTLCFIVLKVVWLLCIYGLLNLGIFRKIKNSVAHFLYYLLFLIEKIISKPCKMQGQWAVSQTEALIPVRRHATLSLNAGMILHNMYRLIKMEYLHRSG